MFDLISSIELTASAAIVVAGLAIMAMRGWRARLAMTAAFAAWFCVVVALGATHALDADRAGVGGLAAAIFGPALLLIWLTIGTARGRAAVLGAALPAMIALQSVRVLGVSFVLLHADGRLPAPFAPVAGWGDIAVGLLALPVAWLAWRDAGAAQPSVLGWNVLGLVDLLAAVGLGAMSSPGPVQMFGGVPDSRLMTSLPWIIIPCFLVPSLIALHVATFVRIARPRHEGMSA